MTTQDRLGGFVAAMPSGLDAALITSPTNRKYYTGFPSSAGTLLVTRGQSYFIVDSRYEEVAKKTITNCQVILQDKLYRQLEKLLKKHKVKTMGIESDTVTMSQYKELQDEVKSVDIPLDRQVSEIIEGQRAIKSQQEIACIRQAQSISDKVFLHILNYIQSGRTELEIAVEMEMTSRRLGSEEVAFSYIVAAGENSSRPHAVPGARPVQAGDFVVLDFGATVEGYRSDMTRTVGVGAVNDRQREVYQLVLQAQLQSMETIRAGASCFQVDKVARDLIDASPYKGTFGHGLGHALGLDIHESPRFSNTSKATLAAGMVMSVEPGIYLPGEFGVRIEDIVAVTDTGYQNLVDSAKELIIL